MGLLLFCPDKPHTLAMFNIDQLNKSYQKNNGIQDICFSIHEATAVGLLGANGAGKSTLIKSMIGLVQPDSGHIDFTGNPPAYLPEQPQIPLSLSALTLLRYKCSHNDLPLKNAEDALLEVRLQPESWSRPISQLSKGMRQRVSLALALCGNSKLILLDEPMSGLDALGRAEILALFQQRKNQGTAFLMSSHIVPDIVQLCDRVLILAHGKLCEEIGIKERSIEEVKLLEKRLAF